MHCIKHTCDLKRTVKNTPCVAGEHAGVQGLRTSGRHGVLDLGLPELLRVPGVERGHKLLAQHMDRGRRVTQRLHHRSDGSQRRQRLLPGHLRSAGRVSEYVCSSRGRGVSSSTKKVGSAKLPVP